MTAYTVIADSDIDPESPITTTLMTRLRDNPIAITEGASGAPAIASVALADYPFSNAAGDISDAGWVFLESWTPTAVNSKDFTWDESVYNRINIVIERVSPGTDGVYMDILLGYNNGGSFITSGYAYSTLPIGGATWTGVTPGAAIRITPQSVGTGNAQSLSASITLSALLKKATGGTEAAPTIVEFSTSLNNTGGVAAAYLGNGTHLIDPTDQDIDTIRLQWSSGNFDSGEGNVYIYGLKRA